MFVLATRAVERCWRTWRSTSRRSVSASSARMRRHRVPQSVHVDRGAAALADLHNAVVGDRRGSSVAGADQWRGPATHWTEPQRPSGNAPEPGPVVVGRRQTQSRRAGGDSLSRSPRRVRFRPLTTHQRRGWRVRGDDGWSAPGARATRTSCPERLTPCRRGRPTPGSAPDGRPVPARCGLGWAPPSDARYSAPRHATPGAN